MLAGAQADDPAEIESARAALTAAEEELERDQKEVRKACCPLLGTSRAQKSSRRCANPMLLDVMWCRRWRTPWTRQTRQETAIPPRTRWYAAAPSLARHCSCVLMVLRAQGDVEAERD